MAQGQLPFQYEEERREFGMTALAGLPVYLDLAQVMELYCTPFVKTLFHDGNPLLSA